ncbi:MAG: hypothetical protein LC117_06315 [Bacteroidia bacterium]|nr:hypothetical protein [Bacteroidia bacterium]
MSLQPKLLLIFLFTAGAIAITAWFIYSTSKLSSQEHGGMENPLRKRFTAFIILFALSAVFLSITIPKSPYFRFSGENPSHVVFIAAKQYNFIMSNQAIDPKKPGGGEDIVIPADELVEFRVTSLDVNHGFGIYDSRGEIVAQTQAMPGYVNRLRWRFITPGHYNIFCLEYCGNAHSFMRGSLTVTEAAAEK